MENILIILIICGSGITALDLPPYFQKCSKSDPNLSKCITNSLKNGWPEFCKGDKEYHLLAFDPLEIKFMALEFDQNLEGFLINTTVSGFRNTQFEDVLVDFNRKTYEFHYMVPVTNTQGNIDMSGAFIGIPITGNGFANFTFYNSKQKFLFEYTLVEMKNKKYMHITNSTLKSVSVGGASFDFEFGNNNSLNDAVNRVFNENWKDVVAQFSDEYNNAYNFIMQTLLNLFFEKIPYDNFYLD